MKRKFSVKDRVKIVGIKKYSGFIGEIDNIVCRQTDRKQIILYEVKNEGNIIGSFLSHYLEKTDLIEPEKIQPRTELKKWISYKLLKDTPTSSAGAIFIYRSGFYICEETHETYSIEVVQSKSKWFKPIYNLGDYLYIRSTTYETRGILHKIGKTIDKKSIPKNATIFGLNPVYSNVDYYLLIDNKYYAFSGETRLATEEEIESTKKHLPKIEDWHLELADDNLNVNLSNQHSFFSINIKDLIEIYKKIKDQTLVTDLVINGIRFSIKGELKQIYEYLKHLNIVD